MLKKTMRIKRNIELFSKRFGVFKGLIAYIKIATSKRMPGDKDKIIGVRIPQSSRSVLIRPKTTDVDAFWQVFIKGDYEFEINFTPHVIVDAGAHVGYSSLYFLHRFPNARIIGIEPESSNADIYANNLSSRANVVLHRAALWRYKAKLNIENPDADSWSFRIQEKDGKSGGVKAVTIAEILNEYKSIDILKLDIEGAEKELFSGNTKWLKQVKMVILELHERYAPGCTELITNVLESYNFKKTLYKGENVIFEKE